MSDSRRFAAHTQLGLFVMPAREKPPRQKPRKLMHVHDAGPSECDGTIVRFQCTRCGHETDWLDGYTVTEAKRGIPCPICNGDPPPSAA